MAGVAVRFLETDRARDLAFAGVASDAFFDGDADRLVDGAGETDRRFGDGDRFAVFCFNSADFSDAFCFNSDVFCLSWKTALSDTFSICSTVD